MRQLAGDGATTDGTVNDTVYTCASPVMSVHAAIANAEQSPVIRTGRSPLDRV